METSSCETFVVNGRKSVLEGLNKLRQDCILCDVVFVVGKMRFPAHRSFLASANEYFYTMFVSDMAEKDKKEITIRGIQADVMEIMLNFFYTGTVNVNTKNVVALLAASSLFMVDNLAKACKLFLLKRVSKVNCIVIFGLADTYSQLKLKEEASEHVRHYFVDLAKTPEFLALSAAQVADIIACDGLNITSEKQVFEAVIRWIEHDPDNRRCDLPRLLSLVRLPFIDRDYLTNSVFPECEGNEACCLLVKSAINQSTPVPQPRQPWVILFAVSRTRASCWLKEGLNLSPVGKWMPGPAMPAAIDGERVEDVAVLGDKVYVAYGSRLAVYDVLKRDWTTGPPLDAGRDRLLAAVDGCLYMMIGEYNLYASRSRSYLHKFDVTESKWTMLTSIKARIVAKAVVDGVLYLIGATQDNVYRYQPGDNTVEKITWNVVDRPTKSSAMFGGKLFMVGGPSEAEVSKCVQIFDPATNEWSLGKDMCLPRFAASLFVVGGKLYVANGNEHNDNVNTSDPVEVYDPVTESWSICGATELYNGMGQVGGRENVVVVLVPHQLQLPECYAAGKPAEANRTEDEEEEMCRVDKESVDEARRGEERTAPQVDPLERKDKGGSSKG